MEWDGNGRWLTADMHGVEWNEMRLMFNMRMVVVR